MSKDIYELEVGDYVNFNCTSEGVEMEMHAGKIEGISICGAACVGVLEAYFNLMKDYEIPIEVGITPMISALEDAFKHHGVDVKITYNKE